MNYYALSFLVFAVLAIALAVWAKGFRRSSHSHRQPPLLTFALTINRVCEAIFPARAPYALANLAEGEHLSGKISYTADNTFGSRFLLAKQGTDAAHIDIAAAADCPIGVCTDAPTAGDLASVDIFGAAPGTHRCQCAGNVAAGVDIYTAAGGQVQVEPTVAGTYWLVGKSNMAGAVNDVIEFTARNPVKVVVLAALTAPTTTAAVDLTTSEALANACKADLTAIHTALASPALLKLL